MIRHFDMKRYPRERKIRTLLGGDYSRKYGMSNCLFYRATVAYLGDLDVQTLPSSSVPLRVFSWRPPRKPLPHRKNPFDCPPEI